MMFIPSFLRVLNLKLRPALKQAHLVSGRTPWRGGLQVHAYSSQAATFHLHEDCLELNYEGKPVNLNYVWLRDHCRSTSSFNADTNQRDVDTAAVDLNIRPESVTVQDGHLLLTWPGGHVSKYSLSWLADNSYERMKQCTIQPRIPWNSDIYNNANIASAKYDKFMSCDDEVKRFLQNYLLYGVAFVDDVPATSEATEAVTQRVGVIRETTYGKMWSVTSDYSRGDTAYSKVALDRHTDTSYLQEPSGWV